MLYEVITTAFYFFEFPGRISGSETGRKMPCHDKDNSGRAIIALFIITILYSIFADQKSQFPKYTILMASAVTLILQLPWVAESKSKKSIFTILSLLTVHAILAVLTSIQSMIPLVIFLSVMICLLMHSLSRITSYNVCYTKLLRLNLPYFRIILPI